jgi:hypothetical protein
VENFETLFLSVRESAGSAGHPPSSTSQIMYVKISLQNCNILLKICTPGEVNILS